MCEIRFNISIEWFTIQNLLYNQMLIFHEQSTKQYTIQVKLNNWIDVAINWSKQSV